MYNKDSLTDAMVAGSLLSAGYLSGLAGHSTGTNAWMTDEQKAGPGKKKAEGSDIDTVEEAFRTG